MMWKESSIPPDSSSSETGKETPPEVVQFTVGESSEESIKERTNAKEKSNMVRSFSQDTNMVYTDDKSTSSFLSKTSFSENALDTPEKGNYRIATNKKSLRDLPTVMSVDDETLSTDSNSTADNDEQKRRRRKLHFPAFRKNKSKLS